MDEPQRESGHEPIDDCPSTGRELSAASSEERAFLRGILAAPDDAELRLVYADWLEERGDVRAEYVRWLLALDVPKLPELVEAEARARLRALRPHIDLQWISAMHRGRKRRLDNRKRGRSDRLRRLQKTAALEADIATFLKQYARKAPRGGEPNDRHYSREVERLVQRMPAEDLDQVMRS